MIRIALCDDSEDALQTLESYVKRLECKEISYEKFPNGEKLMQYMENFDSGFDIYVLDIEMPGKDGITLGKEIRGIDKNAIIIFETSHTEMVFESIKVRLHRFLQKPIEFEKFQEAIFSALELVKERQCFFVFSYDKQDYQILCSEILYIEKMLRKIMIHTNIGEYVSYMNMQEVLEQLDMDVFVRSNVSYVVNMAYIKGITKDTVILGEKLKLPVSKTYRKQVQEKHLQYEMARV